MIIKSSLHFAKLLKEGKKEDIVILQSTQTNHRKLLFPPMYD